MSQFADSRSLREMRDRLLTALKRYESAVSMLESGDQDLASISEQLHGALANLRERIEAEEQQRLLVSELNHRVRNLLQIVIGLANQTLHRSRTLEQFEQAFLGRMQALARAYELLSRDGWRNVFMSELLQTQLAPFACETGRCTMQGNAILLTGNAALSMGLVLYELATNATKYGALSTPDGHIEVSWEVGGKDGSNPELVLRWSESGGPPVQVPTRHGFGSELMQRQLQYKLNGRAAMDFSANGLQVTLTLPAAGAVIEAAGPGQVSG